MIVLKKDISVCVCFCLCVCVCVCVCCVCVCGCVCVTQWPMLHCYHHHHCWCCCHHCQQSYLYWLTESHRFSKHQYMTTSPTQYRQYISPQWSIPMKPVEWKHHLHYAHQIQLSGCILIDRRRVLEVLYHQISWLINDQFIYGGPCVKSY